MHSTQKAIISYYNKNPKAILSTWQIIKQVYPEAKQVQIDLNSPNKDVVNNAKKLKSKLHRKILHHIKKLQEQNIICVHHHQSHGEKLYCLKTNSTLVISEGNNTIVLRKTLRADNYIENHLSDKTIYQITDDPSRVEAVLINYSLCDEQELHSILNIITSHVSDTIGILDAQNLLTPDNINKLSEIAEQHNIRITLIINTDKLLNKQDYNKIITDYLNIKNKHLEAVYRINETIKHKYAHHLQELFNIYINNTKRLNINNTDVCPEYVLRGRAGLYRQTTKQYNTKQKLSILSTGSLVLDAGRIKHNPHVWRALALDAAKTLISRSALLRQEANILLSDFEIISDLNELLCEITPYVRLWNFNIQEENSRLLIESIKNELQQFVEFENIIYSASGLPIHTNILLASAFATYGDLSNRQYGKHTVKTTKDLKNQNLDIRELLVNIFHIDRVRIFREPNLDGLGLYRELMNIIKTYNLPFITYDFQRKNTDKALTEYMV